MEPEVQGRIDPQSNSRWREIREEFRRSGRGAVVQPLLRELTDAAVLESYGAALLPVLPPASALLAVGGFGRGELFPFSDTEVVIVYDGDAPKNLHQALAEFVRLLWEKGIAPNPRVCTAGECLSPREQNTDLSLKLMDRRLLTGDAGFTAKLNGDLEHFFEKQGRRLAQQLIAVTRMRHGKYRNTPCHKEPDVKDGPGGLRDLRLISKLQAFYPERVPPSSGLDEAAVLLSSVRFFVHYRKARDYNLFDIGSQEAMANEYAAGTPPQEWMRGYFRQTRTVYTEARRALDSCETNGSSLIEAFRTAQSKFSNAEFSVVHERVYLRRPAELEADPQMLGRLLHFVAQHGIEPAPETERRIEAAAGPAASRSWWPILKSILTLPHSGKALRALRQTGLMRAILPEWTAVEGAIGENPDQLYTVDEHIILAIERVCELRDSSDPDRRRFADLLSGNEDDAVLQFALLFHHMTAEADNAATRLNLPEADREAVHFLIARQSSLADAGRGRDLDDPAMLRSLADAVGTVERLRQLTVLTYADTAATYTESTLAWHLEQLWQTYLLLQHELTRELETDRIRELPASMTGSADFIKGFPSRYLRAHNAGEIEAHSQLYELSRPTGAAVQLERTGGAYKLTVVARDLPGLFASFAGAISSFGLNILKAEAFSNSKGIILDIFVFADPKRTLELNPSEAERLEDLIRRVAGGKTDARRLLRNRLNPEKKPHALPARVEFDSTACETATLVEIMAEDRPGLLYSLATVFSSHCCNIDVVLIDTKGHRAMDVFYVTQDGAKLPPDKQERLKQELLSVC